MPLSDLIQVPFQDDFGEIPDPSDIQNRVIRILVENSILDVDNKDKFSGWWDVDQEIKSGTELYQQSNPQSRLLKILCEPIGRLCRAMLEPVSYTHLRAHET